jgi:putative acyl-CoA dehydrogenase
MLGLLQEFLFRRVSIMSETHKVFNQATPLLDYDMYFDDVVLVDLINRYGASWAEDKLSAFGRFNGSAEGFNLAVQANSFPPVLETHDRFGQRIDRVDFHPAYHQLMRTSIGHGMHSLPWTNPQDGAHVARAAMLYMAFQNEAGHCCPVSMTYSAIPTLRKQPDLAAIWEPRICSTDYDERHLPAHLKRGITIGMGMTEKQGGSDIRANTTEARPQVEGEVGGGKAYLLTGHKWFCSAPMSDAFLILAKTAKGVSCFFVPRFKPDGSKNTLRIQRLKDKLGNHSNASSELEFVDALGWLVGEEGRGVPTLIEMVNHTRLDCMLGASALMRQATVQALHHARERSAFGKKLVDQPLMANVLADLSLESEAAIRMTMRVARAYDQHQNSASEAAFKRIASAISKYWICKRAPMHVAEALECLGGNGYVEAGPMPRLFRESPLLGIWEGSGNVICLDVLRAVSKEPETLDAFIAEVEKGRGYSRRFDSYISSIKRDLAALKKSAASKNAAVAVGRELGARRLVERLALALQGALMIEQNPGAAADAFIASRIAGGGGFAFGTLPKNIKVNELVARAYLRSR